jgi:hypothetical protein
MYAYVDLVRGQVVAVVVAVVLLEYVSGSVFVAVEDLSM